MVLLEAGGPDSSALIHCPAGLAVLAKNGHSNWAFQAQPQPGWGWNDVLPYFKRSERNERGADDVGCARLKDLFGLSLEGATRIVSPAAIPNDRSLTTVVSPYACSGA